MGALVYKLWQLNRALTTNEEGNGSFLLMGFNSKLGGISMESTFSVEFEQHLLKEERDPCLDAALDTWETEMSEQHSEWDGEEE